MIKKKKGNKMKKKERERARAHTGSVRFENHQARRSTSL